MCQATASPELRQAPALQGFVTLSDHIDCRIQCLNFCREIVNVECSTSAPWKLDIPCWLLETPKGLTRNFEKILVTDGR